MARLHAGTKAELLAAFERVLDSGAFVQGHEVEAFEHEFAAAYGTPHALAVNSGTAALHLALQACGVGPGDEVVTVANTFIATAEAISLVGATPVFADIEPGGFNLDPDDFAAKITSRTRAVIVVHLYGRVAQMDRIVAIAREHGLRVIEDACQAHGSAVDGRRAGTFGDAGCFSFYPTKNVGTVGEGGLVITADDAIAARVASLRNHGQADRHVHVEPGYNYRMPELQAAALRVLVPHLEAWNAARIRAAAWYREELAGTSVALPVEGTAGGHVYHLYVVRHSRRAELQQFLGSRGIASAIHYPTPVHLQPAYASERHGPGSLPRTEAAVREILSLPMHPSITREEVAAVAAAIREFDAQHRQEVAA
ncbi:MAG: DegT/DnrJ/EryC1/StrS family aminotransferase [Dehalococcoidia bacterium]|nr:DegT/DnrJ/EryC1/StrS family aminotransferase [Dehalococcoidia bacterium]